MINRGKKNVLGILIDAVDYEAAVQGIISAARERRSYLASALAVHGLMTGALDPEQKYRLNHFDLLTPDGQPVRWALNLLYRAALPERVYGPRVTALVCAAAARHDLPVFFYGSTTHVLDSMRANLRRNFAGLQIAGMEPSRFRPLLRDEKLKLAERISASGARLVFIGLGCPRQEIWAYEFRHLLPMPLLAVGAAFPFLAGTLPQASPRLQRLGLEWLFRLRTEPARLWRRYVLLNPAYLFLLGLQAARLRTFDPQGRSPSREFHFG